MYKSPYIPIAKARGFTATFGNLQFFFVRKTDYDCLFFHTIIDRQNNESEAKSFVNAKNKKIIMILLTALVIAVIGGIALYMYLVPQKTTVYVFNDNYQAGTALTEKMLTPVQADSKIVVAGKNSNTSSRFVTGADIKAVLNSGDSLRMDVAEGMPLNLSILSVTGGSSVEMNMDPAKIAVTVPVTSITGVTKDLKEGSRVNIYTTGGDANGTTLLFQNMRVLSVEKDSNGELSSATIEVSTDESLKLVYAANTSSIYFGLVDSSGYEYTEEKTPSYAPATTQENQ